MQFVTIQFVSRCSARGDAVFGARAAEMDVASERLAGTTPNGAPVYDKSETIDGHEIQTSATPPLRTLLSTPALPEELVEHLPKVESPR